VVKTSLKYSNRLDTLIEQSQSIDDKQGALESIILISNSIIIVLSIIGLIFTKLLI